MAEDNRERVYDFVKQYRVLEGIAPSYQEIADGTYLSIATVRLQIAVLEAQGRVRRTPGKARSLQIVEEET